jgi:catechol 2,3-dioxygenase-like lactoylglutathione lyase family enzyme
LEARAIVASCPNGQQENIKMPQCHVRGVRSVELVVTNLDEAARFYETVWGLGAIDAAPPFPRREAGQDRAGARYFRGTCSYHHVLGLHRGAQPAVIRIVFDVAERRGVDALHQAITVAGCRATTPKDVTSPGGGYGFGCKDPEGRNFAFVCGCADHADTADQPDRPRRIVHVNLNARDFDASLAFFTETLGFRVIDDNAPLWFLHGAGADHCSIVLGKTELATLNHIAFEMPELESVMRGMGRMREQGYPIEWGPGRHGPGNNVFAYFCGPDEVPLEYTAEVLQIDDSYRPRGTEFWKFKPGRSEQWGITQPRSARYYRVQRLFGFTGDG